MSVWRKSDSGAINRTGNPVKVPANIQSLPAEIMQQIFSYLNNYDLMQVRQVHRKWSNAIMTFPFAQKFVFNLKRAPDSYKILKNSKVAWNHIIIRHCHTSRHPSWDFPAHLNATLMSLTISKCSFNLTWLQGITQQFESLQELTIRKCFICLSSSSNTLNQSDDEGLNQVHSTTKRDPVSVEMIYHTIPAPAKKTQLKLKLDMNSYAATNLLLKEFRNTEVSPFKLTAIEIIIPQPDSDEGIPIKRLCKSDKMKSLIEFSKIVNFCKEARSVGVTAVLIIGDMSLDCYVISEEDNARLEHMYQAAFVRHAFGD